MLFRSVSVLPPVVPGGTLPHPACGFHRTGRSVTAGLACGRSVASSKLMRSLRQELEPMTDPLVDLHPGYRSELTARARPNGKSHHLIQFPPAHLGTISTRTPCDRAGRPSTPYSTTSNNDWADDPPDFPNGSRRCGTCEHPTESPRPARCPGSRGRPARVVALAACRLPGEADCPTVSGTPSPRS